MAVSPIVNYLLSTQNPSGEKGCGTLLTDGSQGPTPAGAPLPPTTYTLEPPGIPYAGTGEGGRGLGGTYPFGLSGINSIASL